MTTIRCTKIRCSVRLLHRRRALVTRRKRKAENVFGMRTAASTCTQRNNPNEPDVARVEMTELLGMSRQPWTARLGFRPADAVYVRPTTAWDLAAVARMHARCSARSLLDRYRSGGRPPAVAALDRALRNPLSFVAFSREGDAVATAVLRRDQAHTATCAEISVLVEDAWQQRGLGSELAAHLAGVARVAGYTELISYPATAVAAVQRLMVEVGRTRVVPEQRDMHLHTYLADNATLGLGSVRERLAG